MMRLAEADRLAEQESRIDGAMDRIAAQAGPSGYLVGEAFSAADLAAGPLREPELAARLTGNVNRIVSGFMQTVRTGHIATDHAVMAVLLNLKE